MFESEETQDHINAKLSNLSKVRHTYTTWRILPKDTFVFNSTESSDSKLRKTIPRIPSY